MTINNCDSRSSLHWQEIYSPQWLILGAMTHVIYTIAFAATDVMFLKPYYWKYQVTEKLRDQVIITGSQVSNASVQRYLNAKGIDKSFTAP